MLVISPNSTCDVCLEGYSSGSNIPHSITCGHVFCQKCLDRLMQSGQYKCPLCRAQLSPQDNRKLHVDCDPAVPGPPLTPENSAEPSTSPSPVEDKERRLLNELARVIREGAKIQEIRGLVDRCKTHYKSLPSDETNPVRISCLLLHHLADSQGKLQTQAKQLREAQATCDEIREHLTSAEHKYQELERTSRDEKEAALAIEKSLREHYDQMNSYWKGQLQTVERERRSLQEALDKARSSQPVAQPRSIEMRYFYSTEPRRPSHHSGDLLPHKKESPNGKVLDEDIDLHLSPLADASAPLASTVQSLRALSDESDEEDMRKNPAPMQEVQVDSEMEQSNVGTPMAYPLHQPAAADPIPIPSRTPLSRQASSVAMSVNPDYWPSGISSSRPRDDVVMSSRPPSPSRRHSSDRMALVHGQRPTDSHMREMELKDMKPRDSEPASKDQVATWRIISSGVSKLHDLLDSPQPSSLHTPRPQRSDYPEPTISRPTSRPSVPSRPSSTQYPSTSTSLSKYPDDPILTERRPLVRASDVAMQLERERLEKLEKERNRRRETPTTSSSLKDTTNAPVESHHHSQRHKHGNGKMKAVHSAPGATFA